MEACDAGLRINAMWERLARKFEKRATDLAGSDEPFARTTALNYARTAEACYWQSTGDEDCVAIKDVL
jgi:hypothetical protein